MIIISVICVKFVLLPVIGIFVVRGASYIGALPADPLYHFVLMIQFTVPPAMNIGQYQYHWYFFKSYIKLKASTCRNVVSVAEI